MFILAYNVQSTGSCTLLIVLETLFWLRILHVMAPDDSYQPQIVPFLNDFSLIVLTKLIEKKKVYETKTAQN